MNRTILSTPHKCSLQQCLCFFVFLLKTKSEILLLISWNFRIENHLMSFFFDFFWCRFFFDSFWCRFFFDFFDSFWCFVCFFDFFWCRICLFCSLFRLVFEQLSRFAFYSSISFSFESLSKKVSRFILFFN